MIDKNLIYRYVLVKEIKENQQNIWQEPKEVSKLYHLIKWLQLKILAKTYLLPYH